jgi:AcrR family transcriptional regulator
LAVDVRNWTLSGHTLKCVVASYPAKICRPGSSGRAETLVARCPEAWSLLRSSVGVRLGGHRRQGNMTRIERTFARRAPKQQRSRQTVDDLLEAVQLVAKRHGSHAITTNRIAEAAGVSIGSLYQYFPDKRAIFTALHDRHVDDVRQVIEQTTAACESAPLEEFARELVQGLVNVHAEGAELHEIVSSAVPESTLGFKTALRHTFGRALSRSDQERYGPDETERMLFVLPRMVESLVHGAAHPARSPSRVMAPGARRSVPYWSS